MFSRRRKYKVTDPGYYDQLISDQKKQVRLNKTDPDSWIELGRLFEERAVMTGEFAEKKFFLRNSFIITLLICISAIICFNFLVDYPVPWKINTISVLILVSSLICMWNLRYPRSGKKYFKKAVALNPNCGVAFLHLGKIALRKNQKLKAWHLMEKAIQLNTKNQNKTKRELKLLYEQEFVKFFKEHSETGIKQQEIIDGQLSKIINLRRKNKDLQKQVASLNDKIGRIKWETGHQVKTIDNEMKNDVLLIRKKYESQITQLKQEFENDSKEKADLKFVKLTTEIMESKSSLETQSFSESALRVESIIGTDSWKQLSKNIQMYLTTAEQIYSVLKNQDAKSDYSLVGMELCKALETLVNQILVKPFVEYIESNQTEFLRINQTGENKNKPVYFTYLSKVVDQVNFPEVTSLTLGQYHFVLKRTLEHDYAVQDYAQFLDKILAESGINIEKQFLDKLEIITKQYRNAIAHRSPMDKKQYEDLRNLVFVGKESLLSILIAYFNKKGINNT